MYLAEEYIKKRGLRSKTNIVYAAPGKVLFGLKNIRTTIMEVVDKKNIGLYLGYRLVAVDANERIAWYEMAEHENYHNKLNEVEIIDDGSRKGIHFDMMHLAPPQIAPDFIKQ